MWARVVTSEGINHELAPWMRMTMPRDLRGKAIDDVQPGQRLGRCWLLLFGLIPFDYDDLGLAELGPGYRFLERSTMLSMRRWEHERTVAERGEGQCEVTDRVAFELRGGAGVEPGVGAADAADPDADVRAPPPAASGVVRALTSRPGAAAD